MVVGSGLPTPAELSSAAATSASRGLPSADRITFILTDWISPAEDTAAGKCLLKNLAALRELKCTTQMFPDQKVDAKDIPVHLNDDKVAAFLVGSPHNHDPEDRPMEGESKGTSARFKQNVFHSMCWNTPNNSAVIMTFSQGACGKLECWSIMQDYPTRITVIAPAWFSSYRPRLGLAADMSELGSPRNPDTVVAIYAPVAFFQQLQWHGEEPHQLDVAATVAQWLRTRNGQLVTFGAYTAELELDIARAVAGARAA